jgi:hypothetical protein
MATPPATSIPQPTAGYGPSRGAPPRYPTLLPGPGPLVPGGVPGSHLPTLMPLPGPGPIAPGQGTARPTPLPGPGPISPGQDRLPAEPVLPVPGRQLIPNPFHPFQYFTNYRGAHSNFTYGR